MPTTVWIAVGLVILGLAGRAGIQHWISSRIVNPVNMPVSLARGHIHTGRFRLNLDTTYMIYVTPNTDWRWEQAHPECDPYQHLETRWVLYRNGKVVDRLEQPNVLPWPSSFSAGPGVYELDVEVMSDFRCVDPAGPRLEVIANTGYYESTAFAGKVALAVSTYLGFVLLLFGPIVRLVQSREHSDGIVKSEAVGQPFEWGRRRALRRPFSGLPAFGVFGGMIFALLAILMMLLAAGFQRTPIGLWVHLLKPGEVPQKTDPWTEPLVILLKDAGPGQEPKLLVNSKQVGWDDLGSVLKQELSEQSEWVVYVGGDDCVSWVNLTLVIDAARAHRAKVFLLAHPNPTPCYMPHGLKR